MQRLSLFFAITTIFCFAALAAGQVNPGTPNWSAYDSGQYDTINLQNLNVVLNVPVMRKSGAFPFSASLTGGNSYVYYNGTSLQPGILATPLTPSINGILAPFGYTQVLARTTSSVTCPSGDGTGSATKYSGWYMQMADGTVHSLPSADVAYGGASCTSTLTDQVTDGSGWTVTVIGGTYSAGTQAGVTVVSRGGLTDDIQTATIQDAQSSPNKISYNSPSGQEFSDTLGKEVLVVNPDTGGQLRWFDVNGGNPTETQTFINPTLKSSFGCSGKSDYTITNSIQTPTSLTTAVGFPDSSSLGLAWEPNEVTSTDYTGRLAKITLRDGSSAVAFNYNPSGAGAPYNFNCTYLMPNSMTRTTSDGTVTYTLAFSSNGSGSNWKETNTKVDIGGNKTVYQFTGLTSAGNSSTYAQVLTQEQYYFNQGTAGSPSYGTPLVKIYCYNNSSPTVANCPTAQVSLPITEVDVFTQLPGMSTSKYARQQTQYDGGPSGSLKHYGNVTYSAQYDFGGTTPVRATTITYAVNGSGNCSNIGSTINDKPCAISTTENDSGTAYTVQSSKYTYDAYGNVTVRSVSPGGGSTFLANTTSNVFNANGTISKSYDLANNETDYTYPSSYSDGTCSNFPFPSKIKNVTTGLAWQYTWDCTGGVMLTAEDPNLNTTTYGYKSSGGAADPWWRVSSITDPLSNETWNTYTATSFESSLEFNSSSSIQNVITTFDGYGRPINVQKQEGVGSGDYDTVSTVYSFSGTEPTVYSSVPCIVTSLGGTCGSTTGFTTFVDMLGRVAAREDSGGAALEYTFGGYGAPVSQNDVLTQLEPAPSGENWKQVQNEYDGLGRLTKSCKISSTASGKVTCGENTGSSSGILTTTAYTAAAGARTTTVSRGPSNQQQRITTVDGLGRVTSRKIPETNNTPWTYTYDTNASCPALYRGTSGFLASSSDPVGNLLCYKYDAMNRVTGVNANGTTCRHFYYDSTYGTLPTGVTTPTYTQGRLAEASTDNCATMSPTIYTDEWFSYDKDGNIIDQWESTPNSTQYYHSSATYTGPSLLTMNLASPSEYTLTYTLDGEGRWSSLKQGTNVVVGAGYNAQGQTIGVSLGSGGTDRNIFTYDSNTGRMKTWDFRVNNITQSATLTWNENWSLYELAITDGFNAGGTQTCSLNSSLVTGTGYDDLGRIVGGSCGTGGATWNQTDSYDQYDNLTKASSGYVSWNPTYSQTTNHYACTGCTTDANGNVTNDGTNAYTWNEFSKMASVNKSGANCATGGDCLVYDAFGRTVEIDVNGGRASEIWYTQLGKTAYMNGATYNRAYAPAPGGGTLENDLTGANYYWHKDWLGNARVISSIPATGNGAVTTDRAFAPYGEIYDIFGGTNTDLNMFTGLTQDVLAGMADTPNREFQESQQGRWLSPDPANSGWNQYAYATNPNSFVDPSGLQLAGPGGCNLIDGCGGPGFGGGGGGGDCWEAMCGIDGIDPSSDCPICSGPYGEFGTAGIAAGFLWLGEAGPNYASGPEGDVGSGSDFTTVPGYKPLSLAQLTALQYTPNWDLFLDPGPPTLCYWNQCGLPTISAGPHRIISALKPPPPRPSISFYDALHTCAAFLSVIMTGNGGNAAPSVDQYPEGQMGTQNSNSYQVYNPVSQGQGAASGNAAGQLGTLGGCTLGALSQ